MKKNKFSKPDGWFSKYIRIRDCDDNGIGRCCTCGVFRHWREADCGHYIPRQYLSTRWHEMNCHLQCKICNAFHGGRMDKHRDYIIDHHGIAVVELLELKHLHEKRTPIRMYPFEIKVIAAEYKEKFNKLRKEKGL